MGVGGVSHGFGRVRVIDANIIQVGGLVGECAQIRTIHDTPVECLVDRAILTTVQLEVEGSARREGGTDGEGSNAVTVGLVVGRVLLASQCVVEADTSIFGEASVFVGPGLDESAGVLAVDGDYLAVLLTALGVIVEDTNGL